MRTAGPCTVLVSSLARCLTAVCLLLSALTPLSCGSCRDDGPQPNSTSAGAPSQGPTFGYLAEQLDAGRNTSLHAKQVFSQYKGKSVAWEGKILDVRRSRDMAEILIDNGTHPTYRGYNVVALTYDHEDAGALKPSQQIRYKGQLNRYSARRGKPVVIHLTGFELLP